ncbi:MAG: hypothetical protein IME98_03765 [Proteobacteria bacterium]|nr:hypothetical protein [Pseudomonadota bacterium]
MIEGLFKRGRFLAQLTREVIKMDRLDRKHKRDLSKKVSEEDRKAPEDTKRAKRPGLDDDAVFKDSASSIDVCI